MSKDKDDEPTPKARGGRRSKKPRSEASLRNLKPWPKGTSGNPAGQPRSVLEITKLARDMTPAVVERLFKIAMNELDEIEVAPRDQIAAGTALMDRGCGRPAIGIYHGTGPGSRPVSWKKALRTAPRSCCAPPR